MVLGCFERNFLPDVILCEEDVFVFCLYCVFLFIQCYQKTGIPGKSGLFRESKFDQRAESSHLISCGKGATKDAKWTQQTKKQEKSGNPDIGLSKSTKLNKWIFTALKWQLWNSHEMNFSFSSSSKVLGDLNKRTKICPKSVLFPEIFFSWS